MKKKYLFSIFLLPLLMTAQDIFSNLDKSQMQTNILYDRAVKVANLVEDNAKVNATYFRQAISELGQSDYSTEFNAHFDFKFIEDAAFRENSIPIGIINVKFDVIKQSAIENGLIQVDANQKVINLSSSNSIFETKERTIVSPIIRKHKGLSTSFIIKDEIVFTNTAKSITKIKADFNDSRGFIDINLNEAVNINYQNSGEKKLTFKVFYSDGSTTQNEAFIIINTSSKDLNSSNKAPGDVGPITSINSTFSYQGTDELSAHIGTGEYQIYYDTVDGILDKPIIFVDGFDPGDGRDIPTMFSTFGAGSPTEDLAALVRNEGFDLVILNFPTYTSASDNTTVIDGGADYIQRNAYTLIELINTINTMKVGTEQNVVIGPSMGGLISRYALRYMEENSLTHDTRLYISFDSPHLGANVPIGLQYMFNALANGPAPNAAAQAAISGLLDSPAAKQMLIDHYSAHMQTGSLYLQEPNATLPQGAIGFRDTFQTELETMGFPLDTRNVSILNGSQNNTLTGSPNATVINTTLDIDATNRANVLLRFTPSANQTNTVTDLSVETFFFVWINLFSFTADAESGNFDGVDSAPGGLFDMTSFDDGTDPLISNFVSQLSITEFCFIPSASALALDYDNTLGVNWNQTFAIDDGTTLNNTPFVNWHSPSNNEGHVELNQPNVDFSIAEIILETLNITSNDISISLEKNPVKNEAIVHSTVNLNNVHVAIYNVLGKKVQELSTSNAKTLIIPTEFSSGIYLLRLTSDEKSFTTRLIVE